MRGFNSPLFLFVIFENCFVRAIELLKKIVEPKLNIMYTLVNEVEGEILAKLNSDAELIHRVRKIAVENDDEDMSITCLHEATEYIEIYSDNISLLKDSDVDSFLSKYGTQVEPNEESDYVELMMDDHKCCKWNDKQFYIPEDSKYSDEEAKIYDVLAYSLHV